MGSQGFIGTVGRVQWLALAGFAKMTCCICLFVERMRMVMSDGLGSGKGLTEKNFFDKPLNPAFGGKLGIECGLISFFRSDIFFAAFSVKYSTHGLAGFVLGGIAIRPVGG